VLAGWVERLLEAIDEAAAARKLTRFLASAAREKITSEG
jgi:hypothetical protein